MSEAQPKESLRQKFKNLFGKKSGSFTVQVKPTSEIFLITEEHLKGLGPESPGSQRLKVLKDLCELVTEKRLENNAIEALWLSIQDLLNPQMPVEYRLATLRFLKCLILGQYDKLGINRAIFFRLIKDHAVEEDLPARFDLLKALSENGKDLTYFEEEIGIFLLEWIPEIVHAHKENDLLALLVNVIKFNACYLEEEIISGFVQHTCVICTSQKTEANIEVSLRVLDAVVCYSCLPVDSLHHFITALCRTVNVVRFCQTSWKLMRNLLGTHLGHSGVYVMCCILENRSIMNDSNLIRGAVFFVGMALWGSKRVTTLKHTPTSVLLSFLKALNGSHMIVAYEVVLSIQRLIKKYGSDVEMVTWDILLDIIEKLLQQVHLFTDKDSLQNEVHDILNTIENIHETNRFHGSAERLFEIVEKWANDRPESSVLRLIGYKAQMIHPTKEGWIQNLQHLMDKYFKQDKRTRIRVKVLNVLSFVLTSTRHIYEDDLIELVVLPQLTHIIDDEDVEVRNEAIQLLVGVALDCQTQHAMDIMNIFEKLISRPMGSHVTPPTSPEVSDSRLSKQHLNQLDDAQLVDIKTAILGLLQIFKNKLFMLPSIHAIRAFELVSRHAKTHYKNDYHSDLASSIRYEIFHCLLQLRADMLHRLGFPDKDGVIRYSHYLLVKDRSDSIQAGKSSSPAVASSRSPTPSGVQLKMSVIPFSESFMTVTLCLSVERDWKVLKMVLTEVTKGLENKSLTLAAGANFDKLCFQLTKMVDDKTLHSKLKNTPPDFKRSDLLQSIYPVLSSLASYHAYLDQNRQTALVESLEHGLVSKCAQLCVKALTLCTIEMQTIMVRLMPSMLLKLSHISATKMVAIPMIEFLSSLTRLPRLYASFNEDQYMSIFAIALPYTNPFKFTLYVVSLAHHVIAMWFIKCRLPFRRDFVSFITKGLRSNALPLFDKSDPVLSSEVRLHRSSSLTERTPLKGSYISSQPTTPTTATGPGGRGRGMTQDVIKTETPDELLNHLHLELTETCIDLMARYAFSTCAAMPRRSPVAEFLLAGGQSQSWLLGNKLVTITTTGSGLNGNKSGLCDKCTTLLRRKETPMPSPREEQSLQVDLTEDQLSASVTIAQTATQRLRQRCKSGSSNRVDSSGNLIPLKPLPREDTKEVKYLSLIASRKSQDSLNSVDSENGISFSASKQDAGLSGRPSHLEVKSHDYTPYLCSCWCQGWAEVHIRCPTGNTSWMMKIQNQPTLAPTMKDLPITDLSEMLLTNVEMETELMDGLTPRSPRGGSFGTSEKKVPQLTTEASLELLDKTATVKKLFPLRRSNSSPGLLGKTDGGEEQHCAELPDVKPSEEDDQFKRMKMRQSKSAIDPMESVRKYSDPTTMKAIMDARKRRSPIKIGSKPSKSDEVQRNTSVVKKDDTPMKAKSATEIAQARSRQISSKIRMGQLEKQPNSIDLPVATVAEEQCQEDSLPPLRRARGYTVSVMSPAKHQYLKRESPMDIRKKRSTTINDANNLNPSFVFLQLYHSSFFGTGSDKPLLLPQTQVIERAVKVIDRIPPYETHKIGVVYVGPGQVNNQAAILSNIYGSSRYVEFLRGLGKLINLKDSEANEIYTGGLDCTGYDGKFAYSWQDDVMQVIFHVATLMPNRSSDPNCNEKKLHIGNDFVTIIYNDSNQQYQLGTIKGQFNFVEIVIQPVDNESNTVTVQAREDLMENSWPKIVSDKNVAMLVRQMALHANLASLIHQSTSQGSVGNAYASNWLERLRLMKRLRHKIQQEQQNSLSPSSSTSPSSPSRRHYATRPRSDSNIDDFTDFV